MLTALTWAAIGFRGLAGYPGLVRGLTRLDGMQGYSLIAVADRLDLPDSQLSWLAIAVPLALGVLALNLGRAGSRDLDRGLYCAGVEIALVLTPVLWLHYFALLLAPAVLLRNTLGIEWTLLLVFWLSPDLDPMRQPLWRLVAAQALIVVWALIEWRQAEPAPLTRRAEGFG